MSLLTLEGTYKDGKISLVDPPAGVVESRVIVTFLTIEREHLKPQMMTYGQFRAEGAPMATEEDFKAAEWHPKPEDLDV
ncbi:MAG TPA: hypothetical protein VIM11_00655 [Tepidisphaeraceae bacterium]|jgi:hypothetical protein